jgi:YD repeat-containing protein
VGEVLQRTFADTDRTVRVLDTNGDGSTRLAQPDGTVTATGAVAHPTWGMAAPLRTPVVRTSPAGLASEVRVSTTMGTGSPAPAGGSWETRTTVDGQAYVDAYDPAVRTLTRVDPTGRESTFVFDERARVVEDRVAGKPPVTYAYDPDGRMATVVVGAGGAATTTSYSYDTATGMVTASRPGTTICFKAPTVTMSTQRR